MLRSNMAPGEILCGMGWTHTYIIVMMMGTKVVPETVVLNELAQLIAWEGFMNVGCHESITSYIVKDFMS
jgi:hypothetical protein